MAKVLDPETILRELDAESTGKLPKRALRAAQRRGAEMVPHLIDLIRNATKAIADGETSDRNNRNGHLFALYLLTEFRAKEALSAIVEAVSLPGEGPFDLFGDAVTEDLNRILAALAEHKPEIIDGLIENRAVNEYVRWQARWPRDRRAKHKRRRGVVSAGTGT